MFIRQIFIIFLMVLGFSVNGVALTSQGIYDLHIINDDYIGGEEAKPNLRLAYLLSKLSNMAYDVHDKNNYILSNIDKIFLNDNGFYDIKPFYFEIEMIGNPFDNSVAGWKISKNIKINGQNKKLVILSFRGTRTDGYINQINDITTDALAMATKFYDNQNIKIHNGFHLRFKLFRENENSILSVNKDTIYILTGHSLGGAIAKLYGASLRERGINENNVLVYTFGAPPVSWNDGNFDSRYNIMSGDLPLKIIESSNQLDPIYHLEFKYLGEDKGYLRRTGQNLIPFNENGELKNNTGCNLAGIIGLDFLATATIQYYDSENLPSCDMDAHTKTLYTYNLHKNLNMISILEQNIKDTNPSEDIDIYLNGYQLSDINRLLHEYPYKKGVRVNSFDSSALTEQERKQLLNELRKMEIFVNYDKFGELGENFQALLKDIVDSKKDVLEIAMNQIDSSTSYDINDYSKLAWGGALNLASSIGDILTLGSSGFITKLSNWKKLEKFSDSLGKLDKALIAFRKANEKLSGPLYTAVKISKSTQFIFLKTLVENGFIVTDEMMGQIKEDETIAGMINSIVGMDGELNKVILETRLKGKKSELGIYFLSLVNDIVTNLIKGSIDVTMTDKAINEAISEVIGALPEFLPVVGPWFNQYKLSQKVSEDIDKKPEVKEAWANYFSVSQQMQDEIKVLAEATFVKRIDIVLNKALKIIKENTTEYYDTSYDKNTKITFNLPNGATIKDGLLKANNGDKITFSIDYTAKNFIACMNDKNSKGATFQLVYLDSLSDDTSKNIPLNFDSSNQELSFNMPSDSIYIIDIEYDRTDEFSILDSTGLCSMPLILESTIVIDNSLNNNTNNNTNTTTNSDGYIYDDFTINKIEQLSTKTISDIYLTQRSFIFDSKNKSYIIVGNYNTKSSYSGFKNENFLIRKYDFSQNILWEINASQIDEDYNNHSYPLSTHFFKVIKDNDNYILIGSTNLFNKYNDNQKNYDSPKIFILKIDNNGNILKKEIINRDFGSYGFFKMDIIKTYDGYIIATDYEVDMMMGHFNIYLAKLDKNLNLLKENIIDDGNENRNINLFQDEDKIFALYSSTENSTTSNSVMNNTKLYLSNNIEILSKTIINNDYIKKIYILSNGDYILDSRKSNMTLPSNNRYIIRVDKNFNEKWKVNIKGEEHFQPFEFKEITQNEGIVSSYEYNRKLNKYEYFIYKIDLNNGNLTELFKKDFGKWDTYYARFEGSAIIKDLDRVFTFISKYDKELNILNFKYNITPVNNKLFLLNENYKDYTVQTQKFTKEWIFDKNITDLTIEKISNSYANSINSLDFIKDENKLKIDLIPDTSKPINELVLQFKDTNGNIVTVSGSETFWSLTRTNHPPRLADGQITQLVSNSNEPASLYIETFDGDGDSVTLSIEDNAGGDVSLNGNQLIASFNDGKTIHTIKIALNDGKEKVVKEFNVLQFNNNSIDNFYSDVDENGDYLYDGIAFGTLKGVIWGQPDPNDPTKRIFRPMDNASLAETLKMIINAEKKAGLIDLKSNNYYAMAYPNWVMPYYSFALDSGALDKEISDLSVIYPNRETIAKLIVKTLNLDIKVTNFDINMSFSDEDEFSDASMKYYGKITHYLGLFMTANQARPQDKISRAELAGVIEKIFMMPEAKVELNPEEPEYGDKVDVSLKDVKAEAINSNFELYNAKNEITMKYIADGKELDNPLDTDKLTLYTDKLYVVIDNKNVKNILTQDLKIKFTDSDNDGVQDKIDRWVYDNRYAYDENQNGIPDILDYLYNLYDKKADDTIIIDGNSIKISEIIKDGGIFEFSIDDNNDSNLTPIKQKITINLKEGWNNVAILAPITLNELIDKIGFDNLLTIQGAKQESSYKEIFVEEDKEFLNSFKKIEVGDAYWFNIANDIEFTYDLNNTDVNKTITIQLKKGWNNISPFKPLTKEVLIDKIGYNNLLVIQGENTVYKKEFVENGNENLNTFEQFKMNQGYWIKVSKDTKLEF